MERTVEYSRTRQVQLLMPMVYSPYQAVCPGRQGGMAEGVGGRVPHV